MSFWNLYEICKMKGNIQNNLNDLMNAPYLFYFLFGFLSQMISQVKGLNLLQKYIYKIYTFLPNTLPFLKRKAFRKTSKE